MPPHLLLIRHAQSEWNARNLWQGQGDPPLSETGRAQARDLALDLADQVFDVVVCSDLQRAIQTAEPIAAQRGLELEILPAFREHNVGAWSGRTHAEIEESWPTELKRFRDGDRAVHLGGGESREEVEMRVRAGMKDLAARYGDRRVALISHLGVIFILSEKRLENATWCALPWDAATESR